MNVPEDKEKYVKNMFSAIAPRYDLLNSILSLNMHKRWRSAAVRKCALKPGDSALDVGAGTLDLTIELSKAVGSAGEVLAVDFCEPMLEIGIGKIKKLGIENIKTQTANAEDLPVEDNSFNSAVNGFVLRNVGSVEKTLAEMTRAVKPGGKVVVLELAQPKNRLFNIIYKAYFFKMLPFIGGMLSRREAYTYLPESVARFHTREELAAIMEKVGLADIEITDLTGGVAAIHTGTKK